MGLLDFIKGELLEIIEWQDDSRDTIAWRFPDDDYDGLLMPPATHRYVHAGVVAMDIGGTWEKADFTDMPALDRRPTAHGLPPEVVAEWHGHMDVDLGSHHGLALEGDTATEGRDEECLITAAPTAAGRVHTHRDLIAMGRATVAECLLTPVDHVWSLLPSFHPASIAVGLVAPLLAGARVTTRPATELADMLATMEHDGITMMAGQWRTPTGPRLALLGTAHAIPALREGTLILADR
jgi:acyl-CoA synthetase (AMP-forming)/AMP-acid ligase II